MSQAPVALKGISWDEAGMAADLCDLVQKAQRGFRRDVAELVDALEPGELLVPLQRSVGGVPLGEQVELSEVKLMPHLLEDPEGGLYCTLFTSEAKLQPLEQKLGWQTEGQPLEYCTLPAVVALHMALDVVDDERVLGLVINPLDESELMLRRHEVASIAQRQPLPLVGYVSDIPLGPDEETLIAEPDEPPPPALIEALEKCLAELEELSAYALLQTFNAERDLEPHLTLQVQTAAEHPRLKELAGLIIEQIDGLVPEPGYIDIVFEEPD